MEENKLGESLTATAKGNQLMSVNNTLDLETSIHFRKKTSFI